MMTPLISLLIDLAVAGLLLAVIIYCRKLTRSIKTLQDSKSEMAKLFAEFDSSIEAAQESVRALKEATGKSEDLLKDKLDTANSIADDLAFMIERGNKMADQLESGLKGGRSAGGAASYKQEKAEPEAPAPSRPAADNSAGKFAGRSKEVSSGGNTGRTASIESVLEQMANRNNPGAKGGKGESKPHSRIRSKAEQELFDSLKSSR